MVTKRNITITITFPALTPKVHEFPCCCKTGFVTLWCHSLTGTTSCEKIGDKYVWFVHKLGLRLEQVCLYPSDENSLLFSHMLAYKASQAQFCMVQYCDIISSDDRYPDSEWEVLDHKGLNNKDRNSSDYSGGVSLPSSTEAEAEAAGYMSEGNLSGSPPNRGDVCSLTESALQLHLKSSVEEDVTQLAADASRGERGGGERQFHRRSWSGNGGGFGQLIAAVDRFDPRAWCDSVMP